MRPSKARYVTVCQQVLAIGTVIAVLGPAADVVSLDVVISRPGHRVEAIAEQPTLTRLPGTPADRRGPDREKSSVETAPVEPVVTDVPLAAATAPAAKGGEESVSAPKKVDGFTTVGVTWDATSDVSDEQIEVLARTRTDGTWSEWAPLEYHDEHAPDPSSDEAEHARPGTDPLIVGEVDEVQAKAITADGVAAEGLTMAVIEPGESKGTEVEPAAIDTAKLDAPTGQESAAAPGDLESSAGDIALQAGTYTPKPQIYSRAQWGANEAMRDASSLRYFEVHAGFVHHTVNANNYTAEQVPGIIRSIYAYHTQTRGWSDIGYNFLVDRFGRTWEGRYGGVDRPVVGAHTSGYNDYAFAMSAIGNFDTVQPTSAMLAAYGKVMGWKLSLHGVSAASTSQKVGTKYFPAVNGHRDAGSTACPGRYLYAQLASIRSQAAQAQASWSGRNRVTDLTGTPHPEIVLRRTSDKAAFVLRTQGMLGFLAPKLTAADWDQFDTVVATPDLNGDGKGDLLARRTSTGRTVVRPGTGSGTFGAVISDTILFKGYDQIASAGDLDRDGRNDMIAREPATGRLFLFRGGGNGWFTPVAMASGWNAYTLVSGAGDLSGDGVPDVLGRDSSGAVWLHPGAGNATLRPRVALPVAGGGSPYDVISGVGDLTGDRRPDLVVRLRSSGSSYVLVGRGDGTFQPKSLGPFAGTAGLRSLSGAQVAGGGDVDFVGVKGASLAVVQHSGLQNVLPLISSGVSFADTTLVLSVGDWDRDGFGDIATRTSAGVLQLRRGLGNGQFAAPVFLGSGWNSVTLISAVGDATGDGLPDLMAQLGSAMRLYPGRGTAGLGPSFVASKPVNASGHLGLGRWNADGAPDSAFRTATALYWQAGNGPGGLTGGIASMNVNLSAYDWVLSTGDVDGNGRPDLVVREKATGILWLLPGTGTGFGARRLLAEGFGGFDLAG